MLYRKKERKKERISQRKTTFAREFLKSTVPHLHENILLVSVKAEVLELPAGHEVLEDLHSFLQHRLMVGKN
jgi:hypothetical protein